MSMKVIYKNKLTFSKAYNMSNNTLLIGEEWVSIENVQVIAK